MCVCACMSIHACKAYTVPWLFLFLTISPNVLYVLVGISKAHCSRKPPFLKWKKITTEEIGKWWDVCPSLGKNRGDPPRWEEQDKQRWGRVDLAWPGKSTDQYWALSSVVSMGGDRVIRSQSRLTRRRDPLGQPVSVSHSCTRSGGACC